MRDIAVAITCYNNEQEVIRFASNLNKQTWNDRIKLVITCNAVNNYEKFMNDVLQVFPSALVFNPGANLGYLSGCLYGIEQLGYAFSWIMISNTDIEFNQDDFFEKALQSVPDDIWCIGPDITLVGSGIHQNPFLKERPSRSKVMIWRTVYSAYPFFWIYFKLYDLKPKKTNFKSASSQFVYAVHGSCFLITTECKDILTKEKNNIFMYGEELLVAEIVRESKKKCYFNSDIGITHNENQVTGKIGNKKKQKWFKSSINYLSERFLR